MTEVDDLIAKVLSSIAPILAKEGIDSVKSMLKETVKSFQQKGTMKTDELNDLAKAIKKTPLSEIQIETDADTLSRWFEIPRDDFERLPKDRLDPEILIRHVYLEQLFSAWLKELGYKVFIGPKMLGVEEWDFIPDVYGEMSTLHGVFQVAVNFVSDEPPSTSRVSFLCESLEAFATKREPEFSEKDIFIIITPFKFSGTASSVILKEDKDHLYYVVKLEGIDISALQRCPAPDDRLKLLQNVVKEAYGPSRKKTWV